MPKPSHASLLYFLTGLVSLAAGVIFYLCVRPETPVLLSEIFGRHPKIYTHARWMFWLPSLIHGFGFTCLLSAAVGIRARNLWAAGVFWWLCNLVYEIYGQPYATFDHLDIVAAAAGCALPGLLYPSIRFLMLNSNKNQAL